MFIICLGKDYLSLLPWKNKVYGIEGKEVMLGANFNGFPPPSISWWYGNRRLVSIPNDQDVSYV